ncbi:Hypothetical protein CINCED_3A008646 [Cinara cedri]|uniref:Uncharacterized protein n=1 Tax=Cinara cedri TaxID=506608 RepID=A0A5E4M4Y7_9HEMI|nr:Hypothetical protein CINCED_3A008646 [Cinara cedri]
MTFAVGRPRYIDFRATGNTARGPCPPPRVTSPPPRALPRGRPSHRAASAGWGHHPPPPGPRRGVAHGVFRPWAAAKTLFHLSFIRKHPIAADLPSCSVSSSHAPCTHETLSVATEVRVPRTYPRYIQLHHDSLGIIMRCRYTILLSASALFVLQLANHGEKCFAEGVPISETYDIPQDMEYKKNVPRDIDQDVQELEKLKSPIGQSESISMIKSHESSYSNLNGKEKSLAKSKQEVNKNGELLAKLEQKVSSNNDQNNVGSQPDTKVQLLVDIPSKGIHKQTSYSSDDEPPRKRDGKYREYDKKNYDSLFPPPVPSYNLEASPEDMAEYIFFTKDDKSVTQAIEKLIQEGRMDRESALAYLSMIDRELYRLDARYSTDAAMDAVNKDIIGNAIKFQKKSNYELSDFSDMDDSMSELKEMQQLLRNKFAKRSKDLQDEEDFNTKRTDRIKKILEAKLRMSDSQYSRLLDTLTTPPEYTYAQTMMDEIIYQLAKLMFNQGLFIGGSEAQESLKKFTDFLETEASKGRISRAMEKKILDLLITSLSDTLTEHPELMAAAKEGFSKYLDTYPNSDSNSVRLSQKKNNNKKKNGGDNSNTRSRVGADKEQRERQQQPTDDDDAAAVVKRSVKTSGIEDDVGGPKN